MNEVKFKANKRDLNALADNVSDIADQIEEMPVMPTPVAADAGKVLTVGESGGWTLGEGGGGGGGGGELPTPTIADLGAALLVVLDEDGTPVKDTIVPVQDITISTGYVPFQNSAYQGEPLDSDILTWYIVIDNVDHELTYQNGALQYEPAGNLRYSVRVDAVTLSVLEFCVTDDRANVVPGTYNVGVKNEHLPVKFGLGWL